MKLRHFESLQPVCPACRASHGQCVPLRIAQIGRVNEGPHDTDIVEGGLICEESSCRCEYPIIDGIPILVSPVRTYVADNIMAITAREDFSEYTESVLGDCCGPSTSFDVLRQHVSSYAWDHYADLDGGSNGDSVYQPGAIVAALKDGLKHASPPVEGPIIDVGCSVGRTSFELAAASDQLVLGVDMHWAMLRCASHVLRRQSVRFAQREVGVVYRRREFPVSFPHADRVDFWACDAMSLPFSGGTFGLAVALNLLDCLSHPVRFLEDLGMVLAEHGQAILTTPFDWSPAATPIVGWLGGHSQRSQHNGCSEAVLEELLHHYGPDWGLQIRDTGESPPWQVRLHRRSLMTYRNYRLILQKRAGKSVPAVCYGSIESDVG